MSSLSTLLTLVGTRAATLGALTGRVNQGKFRVPETTTFENLVKALTPESQGYFNYWLNERRSDGGLTGIGPMTLHGELTMYLPPNKSSTMATIYGVVELLLKTLMDASVFTSSKPLTGGYGLDDDRLDDGIVIFVYEIQYQVPLC